MMIGMIAIPVPLQFGEIQVVALNRAFALLNCFDRPLVQCDRCQTREGSQIFLAAGVAGINLHGIDIDRYTTQRGDCIHHKKRAMGMRNFF